MQQKAEIRFKGIYRIPSARLAQYDYATAGLYFVTICTKDRFCYFGNVKKGEMQLSEIGEVVNKRWLDLPEQFSNLQLGEHVVMPNHIHGIVSLGESVVRDAIRRLVGDVRPTGDAINRPARDAINRVSTGQGGVTGELNPMGKQTLGEIIRWFKGQCTYEINRRSDLSYFQWQPRFHDHIIRNDHSLKRICEYIRTNPEKWEEDEMYVK